MARSTPPELVQQIHTLTRQGLNQTQIARQLGIHQPRVSKIMRVHAIKLTKEWRYLKGNTIYETPEGTRHFVVQSFLNGKPDKTIIRASPEQLHAVALIAAEMLHAPSPCPNANA